MKKKYYFLLPDSKSQILSLGIFHESNSSIMFRASHHTYFGYKFKELYSKNSKTYWQVKNLLKITFQEVMLSRTWKYFYLYVSDILHFYKPCEIILIRFLFTHIPRISYLPGVGNTNPTYQPSSAKKLQIILVNIEA